MKKLISNIIFSNFEGDQILSLPFVTNITIDSNRDNFTDTCNITFPQKFRNEGTTIKEIIKEGYGVKVFLGYKEIGLKLRFEGYVHSILSGSSVEIACEDEAYQYKNKSVGVSFLLENTKISTLLERLGFKNAIYVDAVIGDWEIDKNATILQVLEELKGTFGFLIYWQNSKLYVNAELGKEPGKTIVCRVHGDDSNVPIGEDNIGVRTADIRTIVSYGRSELSDSQTIELWAYYKNNDIDSDIIVSESPVVGSINEMTVPGLNRQELEDLIVQRLPNLWFTGAIGDIKTFGEPSVNHGDWAAVDNVNNREVNGKYDISQVITEFGEGVGYKQFLTLGRLVEDYEG